MYQSKYNVVGSAVLNRSKTLCLSGFLHLAPTQVSRAQGFLSLLLPEDYINTSIQNPLPVIENQTYTLKHTSSKSHVSKSENMD